MSNNAVGIWTLNAQRPAAPGRAVGATSDGDLATSRAEGSTHIGDRDDRARVMVRASFGLLDTRYESRGLFIARTRARGNRLAVAFRARRRGRRSRPRWMRICVTRGPRSHVFERLSARLGGPGGATPRLKASGCCGMVGAVGGGRKRAGITRSRCYCGRVQPVMSPPSSRPAPLWRARRPRA